MPAAQDRPGPYPKVRSGSKADAAGASGEGSAACKKSTYAGAAPHSGVWVTATLRWWSVRRWGRNMQEVCASRRDESDVAAEVEWSRKRREAKVRRCYRCKDSRLGGPRVRIEWSRTRTDKARTLVGPSARMPRFAMSLGRWRRSRYWEAAGNSALVLFWDSVVRGGHVPALLRLGSDAGLVGMKGKGPRKAARRGRRLPRRLEDSLVAIPRPWRIGSFARQPSARISPDNGTRRRPRRSLTLTWQNLATVRLEGSLAGLYFAAAVNPEQRRSRGSRHPAQMSRRSPGGSPRGTCSQRRYPGPPGGEHAAKVGAAIGRYH